MGGFRGGSRIDGDAPEPLENPSPGLHIWNAIGGNNGFSEIANGGNPGGVARNCGAFCPIPEATESQSSTAG
jgi:hypothetical protein